MSNLAPSISDSSEAAQGRMSDAIRAWMIKLNDYPGWQEWQRSKIGYTLRFDDNFIPPSKISGEFIFTEEIDAQHSLIILYLTLVDTLHSLKDVEWYFRRYPFTGTPVTRHNHLTHCCELFFGRFYQFKERLKNLFRALDRAVPDHRIDVGEFIKLFDRTFADEIRARHGVHHRERFDDVAISRVMITGTVAVSEKGWHKEHLSHYRKAANEWAARTRSRADTMDKFVEAVAETLLRVCPFLIATKEVEQ